VDDKSKYLEDSIKAVLEDINNIPELLAMKDLKIRLRFQSKSRACKIFLLNRTKLVFEICY